MCDVQRDVRHAIGWSMKILEVIRRKGSDVVTIDALTSVSDLVELLHRDRIGAVVCLGAEGQVAGIVSERDVVGGLATRGVGILDQPVAAIMTTKVETCTMEDELEALAERMTELRIRHLPVVEDGELKAIVSIGDVVKQRLEDLQAERDHLIDYVSSSPVYSREN